MENQLKPYAKARNIYYNIVVGDKQEYTGTDVSAVRNSLYKLTYRHPDKKFHTVIKDKTLTIWRLE
jgi:hypothetical protein